MTELPESANLQIENASLEWLGDGLPFNPAYGDHYFAREGGYSETLYVFLEQNALPKRWENCERFVIAETGFGTGLNFLATAQSFLKNAPAETILHFVSVEKHPLKRDDIECVISHIPELVPLLKEFLDSYPQNFVSTTYRFSLFNDRVILSLMIGDAIEMYSQLEAKVDAWYLDGFAPSRNSDMWTDALFAQLARLSHEGTTLATFTAAGFVRRGLQAQGFSMKRFPGFGAKREMLSGRFDGDVQMPSGAPWFRFRATSLVSRTATVIGGGIAGITTAVALARRGWQVTLIEREASTASQASGNLVGVVMPRISKRLNEDVRFTFHAFVHAVRELDFLKKQIPNLPWFKTGVVQLVETTRLKNILELRLPESLLCKLTQAQAGELAGAEVSSGGVFFPQAGYLDPVALCEALLEQHSENIKVVKHSNAVNLCRTQAGWRVSDGSDQTLNESEIVVLANAADVSQFAQTRDLTLNSVRGQLCYLPESEVPNLLRPVCYDGYIIPAYQQQVCVGASYERGNPGVEVEESVQRELLQKLKTAIPAFSEKEFPVNGRAAFRAFSNDRLPLIGPAPEITFYESGYRDLHHGRRADSYPPAQYHDGLYVNAGHGSRGLTYSFIAAQSIADRAEGTPCMLPRDLLDALHPARFMVKKLKKKP